MEFYPEGQVEVIVDEPTADERAIIKQIEELGLAFAILALDPTDSEAKRILPDVEQMLEGHPHTHYTPCLSIFVGMVKLRSLSTTAGGDWITYANKRVERMRKYFESA